MMLTTILVLLCISLFVNCVLFLVNLALGIFLVRFRESVDEDKLVLNIKIDKLTKEVLLRLPQRPYGVNVEDREPTLPMGPIDTQIGQ